MTDARKIPYLAEAVLTVRPDAGEPSTFRVSGVHFGGGPLRANAEDQRRRRQRPFGSCQSIQMAAGGAP